MAKALLGSLSVFNVGKTTVAAQQPCHAAVAERRVSFRTLTYSKRQTCLRSSLPSSLLLVRNGHGVLRRSRCSNWSHQGCQPSSSFSTILPERLGPRGIRYLKRSRRMQVKSEDDRQFDRQWSPSPVMRRGAGGSSGNEGMGKVEIVEDDDDDDESGDQVLQEQFNRFAMAMALQDNKLGEQVMEEMRDPESRGDFKDLVDEVTVLQDQLQYLYGEVLKLIEEGDEDTARDMIEANYEMIAEDREAGEQGLEHVAMMDILAQLRMSLGDFEEAEYLLDQIKDVIEDIGIDSMQPLADTILEHIGSMYTALGKPADALPYFIKSVKLQEDILGAESPLIVKTLLGMAAAYSDVDDTSRAIEVYKRVLFILEKSRGPTDESLALPLSHLGHCLLEEGRADEGELALLRALKLVEQKFGAKDGRVGIARCALARAKAAKGAVDESVSMYRMGLQVMEACSTFRDDDPTLETVRTDLAELLNLLERHDEAYELWEANLHIKERAVGPTDPSLVPHLQNLATAYAVAGKYEKCEPLLRRSLKLTTASLGPNAPQVSVPMACLATALHHMGRQYEAEPLARQALLIREAAFGPNSAIVGEACNCLASILDSIGRFEEALSLVKRVLAIQEREVGPESPEILQTLQLMIMLLDKLGRIDDIEPHYLRLAKLTAQLGGDGDMSETDLSDT